jgi:hypothetical protein
MAMAVVVASYFSSPRHLHGISIVEVILSANLLVAEHELCVGEELGYVRIGGGKQGLGSIREQKLSQ